MRGGLGSILLVGTLAAQGCGKSDDANGGDTNGDSGAPGGGATSTGGENSSGGNGQGGSAGDSSGGRGGSSGANATGGASGNAGSDSGGAATGGMSGASAASGGGAGGGGQSGSGGKGAAGGCENGPGAMWCENDKNLVTCGVDGMTTSSVTCPRACHNGECRDDVGDCPVWENYEEVRACALDCGQPPLSSCPSRLGSTCRYTSVETLPSVVRTPWADETCGAECAALDIVIFAQYSYLRVTASPPWAIRTVIPMNCQDLTPCLVLASGVQNSVLVTAPFGSGPANVVFEEFDTEPTCP